MPVHFTRLRIAGFKSFAEPVSVEIRPGLTGIVGPNGCGKSNVVEALRWAMGESSARSLRGGEMDDLIFAGTAARPARNLAEVTLTLEEAAGLAPPPFHEQAELQISRRIERGAGSAYRVNGADLRARDVQTLFADLASGARSSAMVSQGRVSALVGARPEERRSILEEAAGITGLHARRNEAELKLRATDANLARAEDLRLQLEARVQALGEQSQQARRYRAVSAQLRDGQAALLALLHARARAAVAGADAARRDAEAALEAAGQQLALAAQAEQTATEALPSARHTEAEARTHVERARIEAEGAAEAVERAVLEAAQAEARLLQVRRDHAEADGRRNDAADTLRRLEAEQAALETAAAALPDRVAAADAALSATRSALQEATTVARAAEAASVSAGVRGAEAARDRAAAADRLERVVMLLRQLETECQRAQAALPEPSRLAAAEAECAAAADAAQAASAALEQAVEARAGAAHAAEIAGLEAVAATRRRAEATRAFEEAERQATRLAAEGQELQRQLAAAEAGQVPAAELHAAHEAAAAAGKALQSAGAAVEDAEAERGTAATLRLEAGARLQDAERQRAQLAAALARSEEAARRATAQHQALSAEHASAGAALPPAEQVTAAGAARVLAEDALADAQRRLAEADAAQEAAIESARRIEAELAGLREASAALAAEAQGLARALVPDEAGRDWPPLADAIEMAAGLEAALAACLGDGLEAACDPAAPRAWLDFPVADPAIAFAPLPDGVVPLDRLVTAPGQLGRALSHVGLIEAGQDGAALQPALRPGQSLVDRDGALWRWDGFRVAGGQPSPAVLRLQQRSRLRDRQARLAEAEVRIAPAEAEASRLAALRDASVSAARIARQAREPAEQALAQARAEESRIGRRHAEVRARLDGLAPQLARSETACREAEAVLAQARSACEAVAGAAVLQQAHEDARRREAAATGAEAVARLARRDAEHRLAKARDRATVLATRHAESEIAGAALAPLLARTTDQSLSADGRLAEARDGLAALSPDRPDEALRRRQAEAAMAAATERAARTARDAALVRTERCASDRARLASALLEARSRLEALAGRHRAAEAEHGAAQEAVRATEASAADLPDPEAAAAGARLAAARLDIARGAEREAADLGAACIAEQAGILARRDPLAADLGEWQARHAATAASLSATAARLDEAMAEQARQADAPAEAARRAERLQDGLAVATSSHQAASRTLVLAEAAVGQARHDHGVAQAGLGTARETRLRAEARQEQAAAMLAQLLAEVPEPPTDVPDDLSDAAETSLRRRVARLGRERDEIGPVNLRAEIELAGAEEQAQAIRREREEIEGAIARLRNQIGQLNQEGRARLTTVFDAVDRQFQRLFARMFDGGRAHLGMVGSDDPLVAGLEIYAQPPGKKLATLSLLSGGEQALTALSLIFAVFRCNPAPVCVLDEVDAPLDDVNVERFCALLQDMAQSAGTRFLVVTHHQLTMSNMDRLYGVTMQERGVSRVLSVDLARASELAG